MSNVATTLRVPVLRALGALGILSAGCGGSEGAPPILTPDMLTPEGVSAPVTPAPAQIRGDRTAEGEVGPAGGTLSLSNGARLEIPEDALDEDVLVSLSVTSATQAYANRDDIQLVGPSVMAIPPLNAAEGTSFVVSAPIPDLPRDVPQEAIQLAVETTDSHQRVGSSATTQTHWELVPATVSGPRASAEIPALPGQRFQFVVAR